jgi:ACT domain-containing protein
MKIVITIVGHDRVGIVAAVAKTLAEKGVNILDINQNIVNGFFNMVMIADLATATASFADVQAALRATGEAMGVEIKAQHEDIFNAMHRV